jgi:hypothetical protein
MDQVLEAALNRVTEPAPTILGAFPDTKQMSRSNDLRQ